MPQFSTARLISLLVFAVLASLLTLLGVWFASHVERVTEEKDVGYQGEARYNPLLAAQHLVAKMQVEVKAAHHLPKVEHSLQQGDVLLLVQSYRPLSEPQSQALLDWVAHGGHAIVVSNTLNNQENNEEQHQQDPTLQALNVQQWSLQLDDEAILKTPPVAVQLADNTAIFQVDFHPDYVLSVSLDQPPPQNEPLHFLHLAHGKGHVSLLTDAWFLHNAQIDKHDHAPFFWALLNLQQRPQRVWLVYPLSKNLVDGSGIRRKPTQSSYCEDCGVSEGEAAMPSLWALLWEKAWYLLVSLLILLLFSLWLATKRWGGLLPPPSEQRRSLLEHIEASGAFLWQNRQTHQLLRGLRQSVFKDLQQHHPAWLNLSHAELSQRIGEHCAIAPDKVQQALYHVQFASTNSFTEAVQCLKHIRRAL